MLTERSARDHLLLVNELSKFYSFSFCADDECKMGAGLHNCSSSQLGCRAANVTSRN